MKYLGIDYGQKKIGIAVSDSSGRVAFAKMILENKGDETISKIAELMKSEKIDALVMGESRDFQGKENWIMKDLRAFKEALAKNIKTPVIFEPEYMSSMEARRINPSKEDDARAAAIVLQSYLDKLNNK
jgi:putative holliday junction resolvase